MDYPYDYAVIGGDMRQVYLAELLKNKGYRVITYGIGSRFIPEDSFTERNATETAALAQNIICPMPFAEKNGILFHKFNMEDITVLHFISALKKGQRLFAGAFPENIQKAAEEKGIICFDFMKEDSVAVLNSIATAEGAIAEAITRYPYNLQNSKVLVSGFGRCGKTLALKLKSLVKSIEVTVRNQDQKALAESWGLTGVSSELLEEGIGSYDLIFNTVPSVFFHESLLSKMKEGICILDLASAPGGVDYQAAQKLNIDAGLYPGLPGRYSPGASAEILADFILQHSKLRE